jgi:hypothetical protein
MGSLQYEYEWNHGQEKEPSLQCGPMRSNVVSNFSMEDKRVAVELWKTKVSLTRIREQLGMLG